MVSDQLKMQRFRVNHLITHVYSFPNDTGTLTTAKSSPRNLRNGVFFPVG